MKLQTAFLATLIAFTLGGPAFASELADDLRVPFQELSNPFDKANTQPLPSDAAAQMREMLEACAFIPVKQQNGTTVQFGGEIRSNCQSNVIASYEADEKGQPVIGNEVELRLNGANVKVVSWDGSQSDGGDQQALGVYDQSGNRIAVYPSLFVDGNVVDGIAAAVGANLPKVTL